MDKDTLDVIAKLAGPVATVFASLTAAGAAIFFGVSQARNVRRQTQIANDKLALDLFERRIDAYQTIRRAVAKIVTSGVSSTVVEKDFLNGIEQAGFLFGPELRVYLDELYRHLTELDYRNAILKEPNLSSGERARAANERQRHFDAIATFYKHIDELFGPYLSATHKFT